MKKINGMHMNKVIFILLTLFSFSALANSALSMKERSALIDTILEQRFSDVLPEIMER